MSEKRFNCVLGKDYHIINDNFDNMTYFLQERNDVVLVINLLNKLYEENEQLRNELTFLNKVISFFADNPMTKYSSKSELLEEMKLLEEMGLI